MSTSRSRKMNIAFVGCGRFAKFFVPLCTDHPYVDRVYVCDLKREKAEDYKSKFDVEIIDTYEEVLSRSDIDCVMNFTQRHLHGDITLRALRAGKQPVLDVYKAARYTVPGLVAIESAKKGGIPLDVPDFGCGDNK